MALYLNKVSSSTFGILARDAALIDSSFHKLRRICENAGFH